ncbi:DUF5719 family protein, partial [Actinotalea sp. JY-7885]|uniref:DUF5719 family protein n=1 Tax=Actinotalea sp. JY-7885 TaxID=2758576 RepID=UPI00210746AC
AAGDGPAWSAGAVGALTAAGDLRGVAATSCQQPAADVWLVGGGTSLGTSARLVLQNPGSTPATVDVELWGPAGPVDLAGAPEYLVPPGAERVVLLEGVAAEQRRIVVHLRAAGGLVTAYLQDSELRGLLPAGVDYVAAGRAPSQRQVVPGLSVTASEIDGADTAAVRLLAPGDEGGTATLTLLGPDGDVSLPGAEEVELAAGEVLDVPLAGLPAGTYTVVVESEVPVVASALLTRGAGVGRPGAGTLALSPVDRAWAPSVRGGTTGPLALPALPGTSPTLSLGVAPLPDVRGAAEVEVEVLDASGAVVASRDVSLRAGTTTELALADLVDEADGADTAVPAAVVVRTQDPRVAWAVVLVHDDESGQMVSVLAPVAPTRDRPAVDVLVG